MDLTHPKSVTLEVTLNLNDDFPAFTTKESLRKYLESFLSRHMPHGTSPKVTIKYPLS